MLKGKTVLLGVTGSIAAYKIPNLAHMLVKQHCDVQVILTQNATQFITPLTFENLTGTRCMVDSFDRNFQYDVHHIALAKRADLVLVAPASANIIAKLAHGIADDMLTTTVLACACQKLIAPAMNTNMYQNPITQENLASLRHYGFGIIEPAVGMLACKDIGIGKLPSEQLLFDFIEQEIRYPKDLSGLHVLVTAGPTWEALDPVRICTNRSTGKMGYALAKECALRGATVTLVSGKTALEASPFVEKIEVETAAQMFDAVTSRCSKQDIIIKAAAVADYKPQTVFGEKMKKADGEFCITFDRTQDILSYLGAHKPAGQFLCGFSMESENMIENSLKKLVKKNADMIVANNIRVPGAGFAAETNVVTLLTKDAVTPLPKLSKEEVSHCIIDEILRRRSAGVCASCSLETDML